MKQSFYAGIRELFHGSSVVRKYTFKTLNSWDSRALLSRADHQLSQEYTVSGYKCAHFLITDCFECLSPHNTAA